MMDKLYGEILRGELCLDNDFTFGFIKFKKGRDADYAHGKLGLRRLVRDKCTGQIRQTLCASVMSICPTECGDCFEYIWNVTKSMLTKFYGLAEENIFAIAYNSDHHFGVIKTAKRVLQGNVFTSRALTTQKYMYTKEQLRLQTPAMKGSRFVRRWTTITLSETAYQTMQISSSTRNLLC